MEFMTDLIYLLLPASVFTLFQPASLLVMSLPAELSPHFSKF